MKRKTNRRKMLTASDRLSVASELYDFIRGISKAGVKDFFKPHASRKQIRSEISRRLSL